MHALTGGDMTSKVGTKSAGLKANQPAYLKNFAKITVSFEDCKENAEKYLVRVLDKGKYDVNTMDELRLLKYHHEKCITINDLPPTSESTEGHIRRAYYMTYTQINCLSEFRLNPLDYGFALEDEYLVPIKYHRPLPEEIVLKCI